MDALGCIMGHKKARDGGHPLMWVLFRKQTIHCHIDREREREINTYKIQLSVIGIPSSV